MTLKILAGIYILVAVFMYWFLVKSIPIGFYLDNGDWISVVKIYLTCVSMAMAWPVFVVFYILDPTVM